MIVRELVGGEVVTIESHKALREAARLMSECQVGSLAVSRSARPVGIVTERDVLRACAEGADLDSASVAGWMTKDPDSLAPEMTVEAPADWMPAAGYRHLPVLDGVNLVGMVSIKDVLWGLTEPSSE